jgi:hypothetical protein
MSDIQSVKINLKKGIAYICSSSLTVMKLYMSTPPFIKVEWSTLSIEEKFNHLQNAFAGSKTDVPMPDNPREYSKSIMQTFGFKSWEKFCEGGHYCAIDLSKSKKEYLFSPMIYVKEQGSLFGAKKGSEVLSLEATPEEIILTLEKVLEKIPELTEDYYANEDVSEE